MYVSDYLTHVLQFGAVEASLVSFMDCFPRVLYRPRNRMVFVGFVCVCFFLLGLPMVTEVRVGGMGWGDEVLSLVLLYSALVSVYSYQRILSLIPKNFL